MDLEKFNREYTTAVKDYHIDIPEDFNFAFDVIDDRAANRDGVAVIAVSRDGETIRDIRYSDYAEDSARLANAFLSIGISKGDFGWLVIGRIP
ncbi:MAG: hypothetical protein WD185_03930 [Sneathiella sp.]